MSEIHGFVLSLYVEKLKTLIKAQFNRASANFGFYHLDFLFAAAILCLKLLNLNFLYFRRKCFGWSLS